MTKVAVIRGKFLTKYDMRIFENLSPDFNPVGFSSMSVNQKIDFPVVKLFSPMDLPDFPYRMSILNRVLTDAHYLFGLEEKLKGFDIAHTSETYFSYTQQALNAKDKGYVKKVVCSVFENIPFNNEGIRGRKAFKKRARENIDHFIAITRGAKNALMEEGVSKERISVIGMGIDTELFSPGSLKKNSKVINILFVGRLEVFKGVIDLLVAFSRVLKDVELKDYTINLTIVGRGSQEKKIVEFIQENGIKNRVSMETLPYSKLPRKYKESDIFIGPSKSDEYWKEQFGMVFLEAMATGLPILSYNSGSVSEVVGEGGLLSDEGDITSLSNNLKKLIMSQNLREELGNKARKRALKNFDIKKIAKKVEEVYQRI